jgi:hypothetical protein
MGTLTLIFLIATVPALVVWGLAIPATARRSLALLRETFGAEQPEAEVLVRTADGTLAYAPRDTRP